MLVRESGLSSLPEITSDELLPPISRWSVIVGLFLVGTVCVAFVLAAIVKYPVKIIADGIVRPVGESRLVQSPPVEAVVQSIEVQENQLVHKGDVIAKLNTSSLQIREKQLGENIRSVETQLKRVDGQLDASAKQRSAEEQRIDAEVSEKQSALSLAQITHQRFSSLARQGAISLQQRDEKQQAYQSALAEVAQVQATGQATLAGLDRERESLLQRRSELLSQKARDRQELKQVRADMDSYTIRAAATGEIFKLELRNSGQVVRSGETIAQIVPKDAALVVKAQVDGKHIGNISLNQTVYLRVKPYPHTRFGILTGKVVAVSPDVRQAPVSTGQLGKPQESTSFYEVTIQPDALHLGNDHNNRIQPGIEVRADIIVKDETVLLFLLDKAKLLKDL